MVKKMELQEIIERQLREQSQMEERLAALSAHVKHLEEDLDTARKDLLKSKNMNRKLEQSLTSRMSCSSFLFMFLDLRRSFRHKF